MFDRVVIDMTVFPSVKLEVFNGAELLHKAKKDNLHDAIDEVEKNLDDDHVIKVLRFVADNTDLVMMSVGDGESKIVIERNS